MELTTVHISEVNVTRKVKLKAEKKTVSGQQMSPLVREPIYRIIRGGLSSPPVGVAEKL